MTPITVDDLITISPACAHKAPVFVAGLNRAMVQFGIDNKLRVAAFVAQIMHESGALVYVKEIASGKEYEGRKDLGNTHPGDGEKYKGRGLLQITGEINYADCGKYLGIDLLTHPELLEEPLNACLSAGWFWHVHDLNRLADASQFERITRRINGGINGIEQRTKFYNRAIKALSVAYY